jgi:hypothetical protein
MSREWTFGAQYGQAKVVTGEMSGIAFRCRLKGSRLFRSVIRGMVLFSNIMNLCGVPVASL